MKHNRVTNRGTATIAVVAVVAAALLLAGPLAPPLAPVQAQEGCGCPPYQYWDGSKFIICDCGPGGDNPPEPTQVFVPTPGDGGPGGETPMPGSTPGPGGGTPVPGGGVCGNGVRDPGETCGNCPADCGPCPTPTPIPEGATIPIHCAVWPDCPEGWADLDVLYLPEWGQYFVVRVHCLSEEECVFVTTPVPAPTPGPGGHTWPCDYPPTVDGGIIHQPCEAWPGWYIDVEVIIPPAPVLRNPWPRGLVHLENHLWFLGVSDVEKWSEEKALACSGVNYGATYDESTFDCGGSVGTVTEGAHVNYQIGAAWRHWTHGAGPIFGSTPLDEVTWVVPDREWNGGMKVFTGDYLAYTFETTSWELDADGPTWNPECQDRSCSCDERIQDYLGTESYHVNIQTWWWPEYNFRYDEYYCSDRDWGPCFGPAPEPLGQSHRSCGSCDAPGCWQIQECDEWKWRNTTGLEDWCPPGNLNSTTGWCRYDLRQLGARDPLVGWTGVIVAGANPDGSRCGSWTDRWPHYIPIPIIEIQPVGVGW